MLKQPERNRSPCHRWKSEAQLFCFYRLKRGSELQHNINVVLPVHSIAAALVSLNYRWEKRSKIHSSTHVWQKAGIIASQSMQCLLPECSISLKIIIALLLLGMAGKDGSGGGWDRFGDCTRYMAMRLELAGLCTGFCHRKGRRVWRRWCVTILSVLIIFGRLEN